jgi:hypothetical protein
MRETERNSRRAAAKLFDLTPSFASRYSIVVILSGPIGKQRVFVGMIAGKFSCAILDSGVFPALMQPLFAGLWVNMGIGHVCKAH